MKNFNLFLKYELLSGARQWQTLSLPIWFFLVICVLFPLGLNPQPQLLQLIGPGIIWVNVLLAILLCFNHLFQYDYEHGMLDQYLLAPINFHLLVIIKIAVFWLKTCVPLILLTPVMGLLFQLPPAEIYLLMLTLLLGTPILTLFGAINAALVVSLGNPGVILALLTLPLYIPTLIFGANCIQQFMLRTSTLGSLALLGAMLLIAITVLPFVITWALKIGDH